MTGEHTGDTLSVAGELKLSAAEAELVVLIRQLGWGQVTVEVQAGQPWRVLEGVKSRKLGATPVT